ncbi:MAG: peptidoglycan-associated lipoprotein Pal [Gammaproteobacteria bacterium]
MKSIISTLFMAAMIAVLAGCSSTGGSKDGSVADVEDRSTDGDGGVVTGGAAGASSFSGMSLNDPNSPLSRRVIYFEYDSAEITGADQDTLAAHAGYLAANPGQLVTLEGHTDERGSREYNIALGDSRALSVERVLELNGVGTGQLTVVSYGEEKPAADGHSDAAWRLNRRVEIVYQ